MVILAVLAAPTTAQAASTCPPKSLCLFEKPNFQGGMFVVGHDDQFGSPCDRYLVDNKFDNGNAVDEHVSSIKNNDSNRIVTAYMGTRWPTANTSPYFYVTNKQSYADLSWIRTWYGPGGAWTMRNMDNAISAIC
nr:peptidase inhibitor family I36 protein [Kineosporia rhizophila]